MNCEKSFVSLLWSVKSTWVNFNEKKFNQGKSRWIRAKEFYEESAWKYFWKVLSKISFKAKMFWVKNVNVRARVGDFYWHKKKPSNISFKSFQLELDLETFFSLNFLVSFRFRSLSKKFCLRINLKNSFILSWLLTEPQIDILIWFANYFFSGNDKEMKLIEKPTWRLNILNTTFKVGWFSSEGNQRLTYND